MTVERAQSSRTETVRTETFVPDRWKPTTPGNLLIFTSPVPIETPTGWTATDGSGLLFHRMADGTEDGTVTYRTQARAEITEWAGASVPLPLTDMGSSAPSNSAP